VRRISAESLPIFESNHLSVLRNRQSHGEGERGGGGGREGKEYRPQAKNVPREISSALALCIWRAGRWGAPEDSRQWKCQWQ
jgi:hypothetical protein